MSGSLRASLHRGLRSALGLGGGGGRGSAGWWGLLLLDVDAELFDPGAALFAGSLDLAAELDLDGALLQELAQARDLELDVLRHARRGIVEDVARLLVAPAADPDRGHLDLVAAALERHE